MTSSHLSDSKNQHLALPRWTCHSRRSNLWAQPARFCLGHIPKIRGAEQKLDPAEITHNQSVELPGCQSCTQIHVQICWGLFVVPSMASRMRFLHHFLAYLCPSLLVTIITISITIIIPKFYGMFKKLKRLLILLSWYFIRNGLYQGYCTKHHS